jgi:hypothetical protein
MTVAEVIKSGKLNPEGARNFLVGLINGDFQIDASDSSILIAYGAEHHRHYDHVEDVTADTVESFVEMLNDYEEVSTELNDLVALSLKAKPMNGYEC